MKRVVLSLALVGLPFASAARQQDPRPAPPPVSQGPTLRASVDQVVVDVVVTDAAGKVVTGLTAGDFEIRERGQPQAVATFSEVSLATTPRASGQRLTPGDVRSNARAGEGRIFVLVLDDTNIALELTPVVHRSARYFLDRYVEPGDLVAVLTTSGLGDTRQEPTEDLPLVDAAIGRFAGHGYDVAGTASLSRAAATYATRDANPMTTRRTSTTLIDDGSVDDKNDATDEAKERLRLTLRALETAATSFAGVPGRRKTVIFFSHGSPLAALDTEFADLKSRVLGAAARSNVTIYALDPEGLSYPIGLDGRMLEQGGAFDPQQLQPSRDNNMVLTGIQIQRKLMAAAMLRQIAEGTGGTATIDNTNLQAALDHIADESSHYYMLGYVSPDSRRQGRYRSIEVRVTRPGLLVRSRKGYVEPDDKAERKAEAKAKGATKGPLAELIRRPVGTSGLPLRAHAVALPIATNNVSVVVEVGAGAVPFETKGAERINTVDLAIVPVTSGGKVLPAVEGQARLAMLADDADSVRERGLRMLHRLTLEPGRYQLRIAARETVRGAEGSVIYDLTVPDAKKGGLALSGLLISSRRAGGIPSATRDEGLEAALGGRPPTTERTFGVDDVLSAYAEVIDAGASASRPIDLTTVVTDESGRERVRSPQPRANQGRAPGTSFAYAIDLPLKTLAPGRYTLRVEARAAGMREPIVREVAFEVRSAVP